MNFFHLAPEKSSSLDFITNLINQKNELVVGCLLGVSEAEPALEHSFEGRIPPGKLLQLLGGASGTVGHLDVFLVLREPESTFNLTVLTAIDCGYIERGEDKETPHTEAFLKSLVIHKVKIYLRQDEEQLFDGNYQLEEEPGKAEAWFALEFAHVASEWLSEAWGIQVEHG